MATIKHSLILSLDNSPVLVELKLAAISTKWPDANTTETHYVLESSSPPLVAMTEQRTAALRDGRLAIAILMEMGERGPEFAQAYGVLEAMLIGLDSIPPAAALDPLDA